jgi:hypothetical protein
MLITVKVWITGFDECPPCLRQVVARQSEFRKSKSFLAGDLNTTRTHVSPVRSWTDHVRQRVSKSPPWAACSLCCAGLVSSRVNLCSSSQPIESPPNCVGPDSLRAKSTDELAWYLVVLKGTVTTVGQVRTVRDDLCIRPTAPTP